MIRILFVCLGNICRSLMAEMMFRQILKDRKLDKLVSVDSAATSNYETGNPMHLGARKELKLHHIPISEHQARKITTEDFKQNDWIIGMDFQNVETLERLAPNRTCQKKVVLAADVLPDDQTFEIADPWYTNDFQRTYKELMRVLPKWADRIEDSLLESVD